MKWRSIQKVPLNHSTNGKKKVSTYKKLVHINSAISINDLRVRPGNRLEKLEGNLKGHHSVRINDQWRIVFQWIEGNAFDVAIVDYH